MRHLLKFYTLIFILMINQVAAQNPNVTFWECATDLSNSSSSQLNTQSTQNCSKTSSDWLNQYQFMDNYIPNASSFEAIKTIPINLVIFGEDDGSQYPFHIGLDMPNMATYYDQFGIEIPNPYSTSSNLANSFEAWLNSTNVNTAAPTNAAQILNSGNFIPYNFNICNPASLPDSKIRYVIKHYYFYQNSTINNAQVTFSAYAIAENAAGNTYPMINEGSNFQHIVDGQAINLHLGINPDAAAQVNCFLYKYFNYPGAGGWSLEGTYSSQPILYTASASKIYEYLVAPPDSTFPYGPDDWDDISGYAFFFGHLPHELGHRLSLGHIYDSEIITPTNIEFLDDIFECISPQRFRMGNNLMGQDNPIAISPKQMGRMHRILSTDKSIIPGNSTRHFAYGYSAIPHEITGNETWDFTFKSYNDIVVKKGATLTLTCRLEMVKEAAIIVEQGGLLVVDGATITSARSAGTDHEGLWKGIQVWGDSNKGQYQLDPQGFYYQGRVEVRNGAIIENAEIAIQAWKPGSWINGGGIIKTTVATIRNCWKGIHFGFYNIYNSASYSRNSTFETTADLINGDVPQTFIEGWAFKGVKVNSCIFRNTNPNAIDTNQLGRGIYLESAKGIIVGLTTATVTDFCDETNPDWQPNVFENLFKGVELVNFGMQQTNGLFTSTVTRNYFKNCITSIECRGMPAVSINQNKILLGGNSVYHTDNEGIKHLSYSGFSVSENCIEQIGTNADKTVGILISEVGGDNNQVYKNKSKNNEYAYLSNGKNRTAAPTNQIYKGLQFLCNQNFGTQEYDIAVEGDGTLPTDPMNGIRYYQGGTGSNTNSNSAGNLFTNYCPTIESDIYNITPNPIEYFYANNAAEMPQCYSLNVSAQQTTIQNQCLTSIINQNGSSILTPNQKNLLLADFVIKNSQFLAVAIIHNNIIDDGNTQNLLQTISTTLPTDFLSLRNLMLNNSPNLSELVIQNLVSESTILQNSDLLSIIAANPDVARNEELLRMLRDKTNPMDEWMIEFLREAGTYETNRKLLEQTYAQKQFEREEIAWKMVRHLLSDTITDTLNHTELHQWLNIIGSPRAKYMIADDYASIGKFNDAFTVLNMMQERYLDRYEKMELLGMKAWLSLQITLNSDGRNIFELTTAELESIKPFAENERIYGLAGTFAANVLNHYKPKSYLLPNIYPTNTNNIRTSNTGNPNNKRRTIKKLVNNKTNVKSEIGIYPNPVNNFVNIDLNNSPMVYKVNIYSLKGDMVLSQVIVGEKLVKLNVANLSNGTYNLELFDNKGNIIESEKLIVQHN